MTEDAEFVSSDVRALRLFPDVGSTPLARRRWLDGRTIPERPEDCHLALIVTRSLEVFNQQQLPYYPREQINRQV